MKKIVILVLLLVSMRPAMGACPSPLVLQDANAANQNFATTNDASGNCVSHVVIPPSSASADAITATTVNSASVASSVILKASAGNLYSVSMTAGATSLFLLIFDATTAPADGAVTPRANGGSLVYCRGPVANGTLSIDFSGEPPGRFATGITAVASTTGCLTKTAATALGFDGAVQ